MNRIEEFTRGGKNIIYFDFSGFTTDKEFTDFIASAKIVVKKYPPDSIYTITNVEDIKVSANTHNIMSDWLAHNKPYVKSGTVYGADATSKIIGKTATIVSQRSNLAYVTSKEEAIDYLSKLA